MHLQLKFKLNTKYHTDNHIAFYSFTIRCNKKMVDVAELQSRVVKAVDEEVIPLLMEYIRVPSLSPMFDPNWESNGLMVQAQEIILSYVRSRGIVGFTHDLLKEDGRPWMFYGEVAPTAPELGTILIYGHMDKQPHFPDWIPGTNNTEPAIIDDKLYGRGGADDGYALPSAAMLIKILQDMGVPHGRIVIIGETEEESGSPNLMYLVNKLKDRIGNPDIVICLDSGAADYEHLWLTSSLRGYVSVELAVKILKTGMHSGEGSGIVPSTFRIARQLLERIEDSRTGEILIPELYQPLDPSVYAKTSATAKVLGDTVLTKMAWVDGAEPVTRDIVQAILNKSLRPTLCVTGCEGIPPCGTAGNVLRPSTTLKLSIRLPPAIRSDAALEKIREVLLHDPPYNAVVEISKTAHGSGFQTAPLEEWMSEALNRGSNATFGSDTLYYGEGGSIPFMGMLGDMFPNAKFVVTGVLGPNSNAHSANEFLHIPFMKKILTCLGVLIAAHAEHKHQ